MRLAQRVIQAKASGAVCNS